MLSQHYFIAYLILVSIHYKDVLVRAQLSILSSYEASPDIEVGKVVDIELIVVLSSFARINIELWVLVVSNKRLGADEMITPS